MKITFKKIGNTNHPNSVSNVHKDPEKLEAEYSDMFKHCKLALHVWTLEIHNSSGGFFLYPTPWGMAKEKQQKLKA